MRLRLQLPGRSLLQRAVPIGLFAWTLVAAGEQPAARSFGLEPTRASTAHGPDALRRLSVWVERRRRFGSRLEPGVIDELGALLDEVRELEIREPERRPDVIAALITLAGLGETGDEVRESGALGRSPGALGVRELERRFLGSDDQEIARLIARPLNDIEHEGRERRAAARVLYGRHIKGTLGPLLVGARSEDEVLRQMSQEALAGWADVGLHLFFLDELEQGRGSIPAIQKHFEATRDTLGDDTLGRMRGVLGRMLFSEDWREATRGRQLVGVLDARRAVPLLLESLRLWNRRIEEGKGSLRIQHEIVKELQRLSGRSLGAVPERWETWWQRVNEGTIELPEEGDAEAYTSASFFGLRVVSDRVLFVLDRSQSMQSPFRTDGETRYEEAQRQLLAYLEAAGSETRFGVVLFSDDPTRWRAELRPATESNRGKLERWLSGKSPTGGTALRDAVFESVGYRRGRLDLERLDADTVVILCDGETNLGPAWVEPWLREINEDAQLVFHCVQIGRAGDGTLERLAEETGGDLVRVQG